MTHSTRISDVVPTVEDRVVDVARSHPKSWSYDRMLIGNYRRSEHGPSAAAERHADPQPRFLGRRRAAGFAAAVGQLGRPWTLLASVRSSSRSPWPRHCCWPLGWSTPASATATIRSPPPSCEPARSQVIPTSLPAPCWVGRRTTKATCCCSGSATPSPSPRCVVRYTGIVSKPFRAGRGVQLSAPPSVGQQHLLTTGCPSKHQTVNATH